MGGPGSGQHTKMVNQIAISSGMVALCEALLYAYRTGLDAEAVLDLIGRGAAASFSLATYGPRLLRGDLEPGFKIDHFIKDLGIALAEARRMDLALPGLALAQQLYVSARAQDLGQRARRCTRPARRASSGRLDARALDAARPRLRTSRDQFGAAASARREPLLGLGVQRRADDRALVLDLGQHLVRRGLADQQ